MLALAVICAAACGGGMRPLPDIDGGIEPDPRPDCPTEHHAPAGACYCSP